MKTRQERLIAILETEAEMTKRHVQQLIRMVPHLAKIDQKHELIRLSKEESERVRILRRQIKVLRGSA